MKLIVYMKKFWLILMLVSILFLSGDVFAKIPASTDPDIRCSTIWEGDKKVGIIKEKKEFRAEKIFYEKEVKYSSGVMFSYSFKINRNFSSYSGKIQKNGSEYIAIKNGELEINRGGNIVSFFFNKDVIPSSLLILFIHQLLKNNKSLPGEIATIYENTGDTVRVNLKYLFFPDYIKINYIFRKMNLEIFETYFPVMDASYIEAGTTRFIDNRLGGNYIAKIKKGVSEIDDIVSVPDGFSNFYSHELVCYKLTLPQNLSIPESKRQRILGIKEDNNKKIIYLEVGKVNKFQAPEDNFTINSYTKYFVRMQQLRDLSRKIIKGIDGFDNIVVAILEWINKNIEWNEAELNEPFFVLENRGGECQGISNLFLALCLGANIKGRAVAGIVIKKRKSGSFKYFFHQWSELRHQSYWIPIDPTANSKGIGINYIKLANISKPIDILKLAPFLSTIKIEICQEEK